MVDLGQSNHAFEASWSKGDKKDVSLLGIYAAGINTTTFPLLTDHPYIIETLGRILSPSKSPTQQDLQDKVKFGSTRTEPRLFWEIGNENGDTIREKSMDMDDGEQSVDEEEDTDEGD